MVANNAISDGLPINIANAGTNISTYATGDLLYASASNVLSKLPIGSSSTVLVSNGSIPVWANGDASVYIFEDFIGGFSAAAQYTPIGWQNTSSPSGLVESNGSNSNITSTSPGCHSIVPTLATDNTFYGDCASVCVGSIAFGNGVVSATFRISIRTLSSATQRFIFRCGFGDTTAADQANGCYFEYSDTINSGSYVIKTANASTRTTANTTDAPVASVFHKLRIDVNAAGTSVGFFFNDVECTGSPIATNIPTATLGPFMYGSKTVGGNASRINIDYFKLFMNLTTLR